MQHSFDIDVAQEFGVESAIILKNIQFWLKTNEANGKNFHEGKYWVYNSVAAWSELFPYMTKRAISYSLKKLETAGIIISGFFGKKHDRTKWYSLTENTKTPLEAPSSLILQKREMHFTKTTNAFDKNVVMHFTKTTNVNITDNKPDINTDNNNQLTPANPQNDVNASQLWFELTAQIGLTLPIEVEEQLPLLINNENFATANQVRAVLAKLKLYLATYTVSEVVNAILYTCERNLSYLAEPLKRQAKPALPTKPAVERKAVAKKSTAVAVDVAVATAEPVKPSAKVLEVYARWQEVMDVPQDVGITTEEVQLVESALQLGYGVEDLKKAVRGCCICSAWHVEKNLTSLRHILKDKDTIQKFIGLHEANPPFVPNFIGLNDDDEPKTAENAPTSKPFAPDEQIDRQRAAIRALRSKIA
jgi:predicted transcriptional regulator